VPFSFQGPASTKRDFSQNLGRRNWPGKNGDRKKDTRKAVGPKEKGAKGTGEGGDKVKAVGRL